LPVPADEARPPREAARGAAGTSASGTCARAEVAPRMCRRRTRARLETNRVARGRRSRCRPPVLDLYACSAPILPDALPFRLEHRLALEKRRHKTSFSVLVLDIARFKVINDSLGHVRGDELLIEVARRLQSCLRPGDSVARLSGDEFTILLEDVATAADARKVADRLREELRVPFWLGALEVFSGASIGIAHGSATYAHPEDILRDADTALYRAKAQGRGRCVEFDASMHDRAVELLQLETALRRALARNEIRLHYQSGVSLTTGQITGAEALLRWKHPERGLVPPME